LLDDSAVAKPIISKASVEQYIKNYEKPIYQALKIKTYSRILQVPQ
jgi:hypothetical protein